MRLKHILSFGWLLIALFYSGCIPVDDISAVWDEAVLDPDLEGHWKQTGVEYRSQDQYLSFVKKDDVYEIEMTDAEYPHIFDDLPATPNSKARCLTVDGWGVLIIDYTDVIKRFNELDAAISEDKKETDTKLQSGGLQLYKIEDDVLCQYLLKSGVLEKSITNNTIPGTIDPNDMTGPHITKLDMNIIKYITDLADQDTNIEQAVKYERVSNLQESLKKSREYPATDETQKNTLVDVSFPELKYFAEGKTHILLKQLSASPEWKVRDHHGEIFCSRRVFKNGEWQEAHTRSSFDKGIYEGLHFYQIRDSFNFTEEPYGPYETWAKDDYVMKVGPMAGQMNLKLKLNDQGIMSCIAIGQKGLWYGFYEQRKRERRIHTQKALEWLRKFLKDVKDAEKKIQQNGYAKKLLPKNSIKTGEPSLEIQESSEGKRFSIKAWINPQEGGYVFLKLFDNDNNKQLSANTIRFASNEFIGYSNNPKELFPYNCTIYDYDEEWGNINEARLEIWFCPNEGEDVKLIEKTV